MDTHPVSQTSVSAPVVETTPEPVQITAAPPIAGSSRQRSSRLSEQALDEHLLRRLTVIREGDTVLLRLPSDTIKAVVASKEGLVQLGKFGTFPTSQLLGLHYDVTYEVVAGAGAPSRPDTAEGTPVDDEEEAQRPSDKKRKNNKGKGKDSGRGDSRNPGWSSVLRPLKKRPIMEAVVEDITETNEFIFDTTNERELLSHEEITELRAQGVSADEMIKRQMEKHDAFALKTDFSKEKWLKRKERKYMQTVHPLAPSTQNVVAHYGLRSPATIMHLREDTLSQLLTTANIRPDGRYLVVDDTGGLVTAAMADRMGCRGRILLLNDNESPPNWAVLNQMNFGEDALSFVKWLTWLEAEEDYAKPPMPEGEEGSNPQKRLQKLKRYQAQVAELNGTRDELHEGSWDGLIIASELSPISIVARLTPYLGGSGALAVYSPYPQIITEALQYVRRDTSYLASNMTESWTRTYQVLPGRTHPQMTTSATGGYLLSATRVFPSTFVRESHRRFNRNRNKPKAPGDSAPVSAAGSGNEQDIGEASGL